MSESNPGDGPTIQDLREGSTLSGRYVLTKRLGGGAMGVVWKATDNESNTDVVALKVLPPLLWSDESAIEQLQEEARRNHSLAHRAIVRLRNYERDDHWKAAFLVMEYVDGETVSKRVQRLRPRGGGLPLEEVLAWGGDVAEALDYAHKKVGVLHRDVKPGNVMVVESGDGKFAGKLMDFGIARPLAEVRGGGDATGTLRYMSPERLEGEESTSGDVYGLAATLYESLSGKAPFEGDGLRDKILWDAPSAIEGLPAEVNAALLRGLAKDAADRPATAMALIESLREAKSAADRRREAEEAARREAGSVGEVWWRDRVRVVLVSAVAALSLLVVVQWVVLTQSGVNVAASSGGAGLSAADVAALKAASDAAKSEASTLRDQLSTAESQKKSLEDQLASARSGRGASQSQVSALTRERDAAKADANTLRGQLATAESQKKSLEDQLASARSGRGASQSQVSALTRERDAAKADANTLRGQLATAQSRIKTLEGQVASGPSSRPTEVVSLGSGVSMTLVEIPAGRFTMGSPASEPERESDEGPRREVTISKAFWLGQTEVTQAQWAAVMGTNPSEFKGNPNHPVERVSWEDAQAFCRKLSEKTGKKFRLPTEAEWEYACRAGTMTAYSFGNDAGRLGEHAWFVDNSGRSSLDAAAIWAEDRENYGKRLLDNGCMTHAVATRKANAWGLYDMHGNVWEWCSDWYGAYAGGAQTDPTGPRSGDRRVLRGGGWYDHSQLSRVAYRAVGAPVARSDSFGFRVALTP